MLLFALSSVAAPPAGKLPAVFKGSAEMKVDNTTYIDANRILMFVTNHGNFGRDLSDLFGYDFGTWFPYTGDTVYIGQNIDQAGYHSPYYAGGLWAGGVDADTHDTLVIVSEYSDEYVPGPMVGGTFLTDSPEFKVYKLFRDSLADNPNQAYLDYLTYAIEQGAPYQVTEEGDTIPDMIGDQMCWSVFNDANPNQHDNGSGETEPMGLEVRNTTFAFDRQGALGNIVVIRLHVYNKGSRTLENCYFSIWSDPDLGDASDDLVGCDTLLGLGYVYNASNYDGQYGDAPPALGIDFFQGPLIQTDDPADTALMWGDTLIGYKNMGMTSFNKYINGTDPDSYSETFNYMVGKERDGRDYIYDGQVLKYVHTGNPITGEGDIDNAPADRRWMQSTGPITFAPGDSTEIIAAIIVGRGNSNLNSITVVRQLDDFAQQLYENGFNPPRPPAKPVVSLTQLHDELVLTWTDASEVDPGDFDFEGYSVWQGETASGPWTLIKTWDVINDNNVALVDSLTDVETGLVIPDIKRAVKNTGLAYNYTINKDVLINEKLRDVSTYYFKVTAFSFGYYYKGKLVPNQDRFLESQTIVKAVPQSAPAGIYFGNDPHEIIDVTHTVGASDGIVEPIVTDPWALTGDSYLIDFGMDTIVEIDEWTDYEFTYSDTTYGPDTCDMDWVDGSVVVTLCPVFDSTLISSTFHSDTFTTINTFWNAYNTTTNDTLVLRNFNLSGDDNYQIFNGFQLKVIGPPLAGKSWAYASADPPNLSPVAIAADSEYTGGRWFTGGHDGDIFFGGVYMEPNFWGLTSLDPLVDYPEMEVRFRPMASFTDLNGNGKYDFSEPYEVDEPSQTQNAFMYSGVDWTGADYLYFNPVPFTAWDVTDPGNPRQVNVVVRDRDLNGQWDINYVPLVADPLLPNGGNTEKNYIWLLTTDYDPSGTYYGDGTGGSIDFFSYSNGYGVWDAAWVLWFNDRQNGGMLAEECAFTVYPNIVIKAEDTYEFSSSTITKKYDESELDAIKAVPNPFYMIGPYDPSPGSYQICFHHLPEKCSIDIYTLAGDLIRTLQKDDASTAIACWDVLTEQGLPIASGIYIYVVNAEGFGTKIGKMAVFVQEEVLDIY